jgi:hypothetical protein
MRPDLCRSLARRVWCPYAWPASGSEGVQDPIRAQARSAGKVGPMLPNLSGTWRLRGLLRRAFHGIARELDTSTSQPGCVSTVL